MNRWLEKEIQILTEKYLKVSIDEITKLIPNHSRQSICRKASYLGLTNFTTSQSISQRIYTYNENFFDTPNVQNCYWAGFIAADGYLGKDGNIKISLATKDNEIVDNFKLHTSYNGPIKYCSYSGHDYVMISIWGAYRWQQHLNYNWRIPLKNKTNELIPPENLTQQLIHAYIIGLIDGDGSIRYQGKNLILSFCGTYEIVKWVNSIWSNIINKDIKIRLNGKSKNNYYTSVYCKNALQVCKELCTVDIVWKLERKWKKIDSLA